MLANNDFCLLIANVTLWLVKKLVGGVIFFIDGTQSTERHNDVVTYHRTFVSGYKEILDFSYTVYSVYLRVT